jgi:hypothetical protein
VNAPVVAACVRCSSPLEQGDFRCAICSLPTPIPASAPSHAREVTAAVMRCNGCGAAVAYDAKAAAPKCAFCGSVTQLEQQEDPLEQAEAFLVFRVDPEQAKAALKQWMSGLGWFRPKDLRDTAVVDKLEPLWWAGWAFDASVGVTWAADSDAGAGRSAWAPHSGSFALELDNVLVSASRGLTDAECEALAPGYNLSDCTPTPGEQRRAPHGNNGKVEQFDVQRSAARTTISRALTNVAANHARPRVPGSSVRNLRVAVVPERMATRRLGFPAYVLAYRYNDAVYRAIVHGQNPQFVVGKAPWSWARIVMIVLAAVAAIGLIALVVALLSGR